MAHNNIPFDQFFVQLNIGGAQKPSKHRGGAFSVRKPVGGAGIRTAMPTTPTEVPPFAPEMSRGPRATFAQPQASPAMPSPTFEPLIFPERTNGSQQERIFVPPQVSPARDQRPQEALAELLNMASTGNPVNVPEPTQSMPTKGILRKSSFAAPKAYSTEEFLNAQKSTIAFVQKETSETSTSPNPESPKSPNVLLVQTGSIIDFPENTSSLSISSATTSSTPISHQTSTVPSARPSTMTTSTIPTTAPSNAPTSSETSPKNSSSSSKAESNDKDSPKEPKPDADPPRKFAKARRYVPEKKDEERLFASENNIEAGPYFEETYGDLEISISGGDETKVLLESFSDCNFPSIMMQNIENLKYVRPMPIQKAVIPIISSKREYDLMGHAQTGSGKTAAYLLPIIHAIKQHKLATGFTHNGDSPYALILAPTRELAQQIWDDAKKFAAGCTNVRVAAAYGQYYTPSNIRDIRSGCDILCATVGRLLRFVADDKVKLDKLMFFVLDEADRLLEDQFFEDIITLNRSSKIASNKNTYMFSATFNEEIQTVAREFLRPNHFFVSVGKLNMAAQNVEQGFLKVKNVDKTDALKELIQKSVIGTEWNQKLEKKLTRVEKTLVFVDRKFNADRIPIMLMTQLNIKAIGLYGDLSQDMRQHNLDSFIKGEIDVLVATNVCARGLNIKGVKHVINYDLGRDRENYIHRIGRTGRVGHPGKATSFFDDTNENDRYLAADLIQILTIAGQQENIPKFLRETAESMKYEPKRHGYYSL